MLFHPKTLKEIFCSKERFDLLFDFNSTSINQTDLQQRLCNMSDEDYQELSNLLHNSISDEDLIRMVKEFSFERNQSHPSI